MTYGVLADATLVVHALFVLFVAVGGLLVARWHHVAWVHLPAVAWAVWIEISGRICPLTPLETWLRVRSGEAGYEVGFIEHYVGPVLYPPSLTREMQWLLAGVALAVNAFWYLRAFRTHRNVRRAVR